MKSLGSVVPGFLLVFGCGSGGAPPSVTSSSLPVGSAARAGAELVSANTVARIAERQGIAPRAALDLALSDALFAAEARSNLPLGASLSIDRAAAARGLLEQLARDATQAGAPTPAELAELTRERWLEFDRPSAVRTTHAVVLNGKPELDAQARTLAEKLAEAVRTAGSESELIRQANAVPTAGLQIRAEALPFVTADGRVFSRKGDGFKVGQGTFNVDFARAANALQTPGQQSSVVKTSFGYHVIRLEERLPGVVAPEAELSERLAPDVMVRRAGRARRELLDKLRQAAPVQIERAVNELTARVQAP